MLFLKSNKISNKYKPNYVNLATFIGFCFEIGEGG